MRKEMVKTIQFDGIELLGVKTEDGKIYMGVKKFLEEIGFKEERQMKYQRTKILNDATLQRGYRVVSLPTTGGIQEVQCLELEYIPLAMVKFNPNDLHKKSKSLTDEEKEVFRAKLIKYQEKAKDILAKEFLSDTETAKEFKEDFKLIANLEKRINALEQENGELKEFYNAYIKVLEAPNSQTMNDIAKVLDVGRNKLFAFLRSKKILMKDNKPYQRFCKSGYFRVKEFVLPNDEIATQTFVTGKGLDYIKKQLDKVQYSI